jgi:hypothetical protein
VAFELEEDEPDPDPSPTGASPEHQKDSKIQNK